jgi:hypothetical protein
MTLVDVDAELRRLKDFQRRTVDHGFDRLYLDDNGSRRFLVADEVGLGKTLVARGIVARAVDHLERRGVRRIDVVYVCSNGEIARQNVRKLVGNRDVTVLPSRVTLLAKEVHRLEEIRAGQSSKLNVVALTPGTSFDPRSSLGRSDERVLLTRILTSRLDLSPTRIRNVLQGRSGGASFASELRGARHDAMPPSELVDLFLEHVEGSQTDAGVPLLEALETLCDESPRAREWRGRPDEQRDRIRELVGALRAELAIASITALEPDLVILDEFQRFVHLLDGDDLPARLAQTLFRFERGTEQARTLLLSATPYRMLSVAGDGGGDHHREFLRTYSFLAAGDAEARAELEGSLERFRAALYREPAALDEIERERSAIERRLRQVMARTERLAATEDRNGMLREPPPRVCDLRPDDLTDYVAISRLARALEQHGVLEYWKAVPYLLNMTDGYELRRALHHEIGADPVWLAETLREHAPRQLRREAVDRRERVDPGNPRMRALYEDTIGAGAWRRLWIAPALPHYELSGPFAGADSFTKRLVFSAWQMVPRAVAALLSYEAEREIGALGGGAGGSYFRTPRQVLRLQTRDGEPATMTTLALLWPSVGLAEIADPLDVAAEADERLTLDEAVNIAERRIASALASLLAPRTREEGGFDPAWYWAAPVLLDLQHPAGEESVALLTDPSAWPAGDEDDEPAGLTAHLDRVRALVNGELALGSQPPDLAATLARLAFGAPGVTALRALARGFDAPDAVTAACALDVAWGMRALFNLPEAVTLVRGAAPDDSYWLSCAEYGAAGGLQAVLDEYVHVFSDTESLDLAEDDQLAELAERMHDALAIRTSVAAVDEVVVDDGIVDLERMNLRSRFAARFATERSEDGTTRADHIRLAFNSPFWPFVLATTSVGQEGLDFHLYCHAIVHWNLPNNPVDLEQREGRVHRYKNHAVRRNVAQTHGRAALREGVSDAWAAAFDLAADDRPSDADDLRPFWVHPAPGGATIDRYVLAEPMSRDRRRLAELKRALTVYRMAFGQARQDDLVTFLADRPDNERDRIAAAARIDLAPAAG